MTFRYAWIILLFLSASYTHGQNSDALAASRELLAVRGVDESYFQFLQDGQAISDDEWETVYRILFAFDDLSKAGMYRFVQPRISWDELGETPEAFRAALYSIRGTVTSIQKVALSSEEADRFRMENVFLLQLALPEDRTATVISKSIPRDWPTAENSPLSLTVSATAMFLKVGDTQSATVWLTDSVAWHPQNAAEAPSLGDSLIRLGRWNVDVNLVHQLRHGDPLTPADRTLFYQMLHAIKSLPNQQWQDAVPSEVNRFQIAELLKNARQQVGELYNIQGVARRCVRIEIQDADIRELYGLEHYFEVEVFVPLPTRLLLKDPVQNVEVEYQTYPFVFCLAELPTEMKVGPDIRTDVQVAGTYFKLWAFRNQLLENQAPAGERRFQKAPLLIGKSLQLVSNTPATGSNWMLFVGSAFVISLLLVGWVLVRNERFDRTVREQRLQLPDALPEISEKPESSTQ